ncbi:MAG: hypothetical protein RIM80_10585, partial [Alphaproteobacteria bacterium]
AFFGHQAGSFVGALGGGWIFERMGAYDVAWQLGVGVGLLAGATQIACALAWDPRARGRAAAACTPPSAASSRACRALMGAGSML